MSTTRLLGFIATAAVVLSPALMLSLRGGTGYCYFVVLALSLIHLSSAENRRSAAELYRRHRPLVFALSALPSIVLFQIVVLRDGTFPSLDPLLRLPLVIPSFFFLATLPSRQLRWVQWGFVVGALGTGGWVFYQLAHPHVAYGAVRVGNTFTNPIPFGDTALVLGFLSMASIRRSADATSAEVIVKTLAMLAGCYASYASGARGGWIALPFLIWAAAGGRHWLVNVKARIALGAAVLACIGALAGTSVVRDRVDAFGSDITAMERGDPDTSTGIRLNLWRASVQLYLEHPVFGVGRGSLERELRAKAQRGEVPEVIVNGRAHSEFFSILAEMGTVGVAALLFLYGATFMPFWRNRRDADPEIATASYLGLAMVGGTIIFGLTIDVLTLVMNAAFFALTVATLLAWIEARKRELSAASGMCSRCDGAVDTPVSRIEHANISGRQVPGQLASQLPPSRTDIDRE
ncbi:O-antigen ligase family protein [Burkholderia pseudomallei]|uniref:O-antigen ligase family protein n=1 Tax=Burkholderia pseudomallei TaxID=28450 RepID=UPI0005DA4A26|nr:O-antigen ligase [Burkholderia pseudomallei]AJX73230.1 O-Antigen ligase family protein [Burkholderia pseudomallei MSHR840]